MPLTPCCSRVNCTNFDLGKEEGGVIIHVVLQFDFSPNMKWTPFQLNKCACYGLHPARGCSLLYSQWGVAGETVDHRSHTEDGAVRSSGKSVLLLRQAWPGTGVLRRIGEALPQAGSLVGEPDGL